MPEKLAMTYDAINEAIQSVDNVRDNFNSVVDSAGSLVESLLGSFFGKAAKVFTAIWSDPLANIFKGLFQRMERQNERLKKIMDVVQELDDDLAQLFQITR